MVRIWEPDSQSSEFQRIVLVGCLVLRDRKKRGCQIPKTNCDHTQNRNLNFTLLVLQIIEEQFVIKSKFSVI